jgi:hypothetical protein
MPISWFLITFSCRTRVYFNQKKQITDKFNMRHIHRIVGWVITSIIGGVIIPTIFTDGRSNRNAVGCLFSTRYGLEQWLHVQSNAQYHNGWFKRNLRMSYSTFLKVVRLVEMNWCFPKPHHNSTFKIKDQVAVTLKYLTNTGSITTAANEFGMGKATAIRAIRKVSYVLAQKIAKKVIRLPTLKQEWDAISHEFESRYGLPNVVGAIDGTIIRVQRPCDHEGWYCRKGFPAVNMQGVVDSKKRFMSFSIRPGSANDKSVYRRSTFGRNIHTLIPRGRFFLGDSGYQLLGHLLIPFPIDNITADQLRFNTIHSKTRMVVENAFGLLKTRFQILRTIMESKSQAHLSNLIISCVALHNILIDLGEEDLQLLPDPWENLPDIIPEVMDYDRLNEVLEADEAKSIRYSVMNYLKHILD